MCDTEKKTYQRKLLMVSRFYHLFIKLRWTQIIFFRQTEEFEFAPSKISALAITCRFQVALSLTPFCPVNLALGPVHFTITTSSASPPLDRAYRSPLDLLHNRAWCEKQKWMAVRFSGTRRMVSILRSPDDVKISVMTAASTCHFEDTWANCSGREVKETAWRYLIF